MTDFIDYTKTGIRYNAMKKFNESPYIYYWSGAGMLSAGAFPLVFIGVYLYTKSLNDTLYASSVYGIAAGLLFSIMYGILWRISDRDAKKNPEKKTDGPAVYRGVFFANVAMLIVSGLTILIMLFIDMINKKKAQLK